MAIDRNALDAITGERKGKKNQSRFEDRPKAPSQSPRQQLGLVDYSAFDIGKYKPYSKPAAPVTVEPRGFKETPITVERPEPTKGPYTGVMTRGVQGQGMGQVGVGGSMAIPPALAGDRAALAAAERMRPNQSPRPPQEIPQTQPAPQSVMGDVRMAEREITQPETPAQKPVVEQTPSSETTRAMGIRSEAMGKRDALRAQIAAEQQRMLMARRQAEGARRRGVPMEQFDEGASLNKIAELRSELAGYERAATSPQQIRVKTAEENMAAEQNLAQQASSILQTDINNLRNQIVNAPEGESKNAMMSRLRTMESKKLEMDRAASPETQDRMLAEGVARTERQREAASSMGMRQDAMGEAAFKVAEISQGKRLGREQEAEARRRAAQEATLAEISAPERERALRERVIESGLKESEAKTKESEARIGLTTAQIKEIEARVAANATSLTNDPNYRKAMIDTAQAQADGAKLVNEYNAAKNRALAKFGDLIPEEVQQQIDNINVKAKSRLGVDDAGHNLALNAADRISASLGSGNVYRGAADARQDIIAVDQIAAFADGLEQYAKMGPSQRQEAQTLAKRFVTKFSGPITGAGPGAEGLIGTFTAGAGGGALVGGGIGSFVPVAGTAVGATIGAIVGGVGAVLGYSGATTNEDNIKVMTKFNDALTKLQQVGQ
jgi:hypothetical protein